MRETARQIIPEETEPGILWVPIIYSIFPSMPDSISPASITVEQANTLLKSFDCANPRNDSEVSPQTLQDALLTLHHHADYHIFGICADTIAQGMATLTEYAKALDDALEVAPPSWEGPVYIKYNTKTGLFHVDTYVGTHRGVLVSFQSAYDHGVNDLYGHFPLDLFAKDT